MLSNNQRELVKFLKPYVLYTQSKKRIGKHRYDSEDDFSLGARLHPAEEALLDFKPDENEIDGKLYDGIVELDNPYVRDRRQVDDGEDSESCETDNSSEDEGFEIGGKRGFNTNMDDFLKNFGSVSAKTSNHQSPKRRSVSTHLEENRKSIQK